MSQTADHLDELPIAREAREEWRRRSWIIPIQPKSRTTGGSFEELSRGMWAQAERTEALAEEMTAIAAVNTAWLRDFRPFYDQYLELVDRQEKAAQKQAALNKRVSLTTVGIATLTLLVLAYDSGVLSKLWALIHGA